MRLFRVSIFCFFLSLFFSNHGYGQNPTGLPQKDSLAFNQLHIILKKRVILSATDYAEAQSFFLTGQSDAAAGKQCERLLAGAEEKINTDINRVNAFFFSFQRLAEQLYSRRISKVDPLAMAACRRSLAGLNQRLDARKKVRTFYANEKDQGVCREQLKNSLDILANHVSARSFPSVLAAFEKTLKQAYPFWNARYHELQQIRDAQGRGDVDRPRDELNAEEKQFMYLFGKIQTGIRTLSVSNSW